MARHSIGAGHLGGVLAVLAATLFAPPAVARDCLSLKDPSEIKDCLEVELRDANFRLGHVYGNLRKSRDEQAKEKLRREQLAWMSARNRTCGIDSGRDDYEAWVRDVLRNNATAACVVRETLARLYVLAPSERPAPPADTPPVVAAPETPKPAETAPATPQPAPPPEPPAPRPAPVDDGRFGVGFFVSIAVLLAVVGGVAALLYRYGRSALRGAASLVKFAASSVSRFVMNRTRRAPAEPALDQPAPAPAGRRLAWFKIVTYGVWGLFVAWLLWQSVHDLWLLSGDPSADALRKEAQQYGMFVGRDELEALANRRALDNLVLNLWALLGAAALARARFRFGSWGPTRLIIIGGLAFAVCLGRPMQGLVSHYAIALFERGPIADLVLWLIVNPLLMLFSGSVVIGLISAAIATALMVLVAIPIMVGRSILDFQNELARWRYHRAGLVGVIVRVAYWLMGEPVPDAPPDDSGAARFAAPSEIAELYDPRGMAFGHVGDTPLLIHTEKHVLIMASTRSGKGVSLIIPHLLRYQGSAFVLDPKGENAKATGRQRALLNDTVHVLDPFGISGKPRARFNPLARFTPDNMEAESKALAAALVLGERDHWTASAQQLLAAFILHVVTADSIPPENKDLPAVRKLLLANAMGTLREMSKSDAAGGLVGDLAGSFLNTPDKEFGSIISTAQRETEILDNPFIIASLSASGPGEEVDFKAWRGGTMTVYLCLSAPKFPVFNRWLRLVLTAALDEMTDTLDPPPLPVCFMLDELATLGHLKPVENAVGLAAGYGIQLVTVFQDVAQMRDLYKGRWASFIGNAGVRALFALDDFDSADYWSRFMGGHVVQTTSRQEDIYGLSSARSVGETLRPLLSPEQLMKLYAAGPNGTGAMLLLPEGSHPIQTQKVPYFNDPALEGLWDDPRAAPEPAAQPATLLLLTAE